jgi:phosphoglycerate dehydrogenase-like enzyme
MATDPPPQIAVEPASTAEVFPWMLDALRAGGAEIVPVDQAQALLWGALERPERLAELLAAHGDHLRWVQLPWAGTEPYLDILDDGRVWTSAKGVYAEQCAEMALTLALAGRRGIGSYARATTWKGLPERTHTLYGAEVCILGGGGIARSLIELLVPFRTRTTVVRRTAGPLDGVDRVLTPEHLDEALAGADVVVLALALTAATTGILDARRLALLGPHTWVVNVARGGHIVTDDLVDALRRGAIGGAALDVTDPEPLPDGHPLWTLPNCIITPHESNTADTAVVPLTARLVENVRRFAAGGELLGVVDPVEGY